MDADALAEGWTLWNRESTKIVLTYRPDVFNSQEYPPPCLPTIHIRKGRRSRRPGRNTPDPDDPWYVTLYLEPEVSGDRQTHDTREAAFEAAAALTDQFVDGEIDYRSLYQVPRPEYLDRLDELTGRD